MGLGVQRGTKSEGYVEIENDQGSERKIIKNIYGWVGTEYILQFHSIGFLEWTHHGRVT